MSDAERYDVLTGMLVDASIMIRELTWEVSQHREVDRETQFLKDLEAIIGKNL